MPEEEISGKVVSISLEFQPHIWFEQVGLIGRVEILGAGDYPTPQGARLDEADLYIDGLSCSGAKLLEKISQLSGRELWVVLTRAINGYASVASFSTRQGEKEEPW